jgi:branched-chain amino acid transport system substrate-binding protein
MMPITEENKVVHINFSYSPKITEMGYKFTFRDAAGSAITIPPLADYLVGKKKVKNWSVLVINNDYGRGDGDKFAEGVRKNGGKIVSYDVIEWGTTDFYPFITKIKGYKPEGIRITEYESSGIGFVKQLRQLDFKGVLSTCDLIINDMPLKKLGKLADGIYGETVYEPHLYAASRAFDKVYFDKYKEHSQRNNAMGYSAVNVLARAMKKAKTNTDTEKIAKAITQLRYEQVMGPAYYDGKGQLQVNAYVVKVKGGKRHIVYPK